MSTEPVSIRVLDREYTVGVSAEARDALLAAARVLDGKMREVRGSNRMAAVDRVAVLAALNLAYELQELRALHETRERELRSVLDRLERRLDSLD